MSPTEDGFADFEDLQAEARELAERVDEYLRRGSLRSAQKAFSQSWRDAVPDLPQRFSVILVQAEKSVIAEMLKEMRAGNEPPKLKFSKGNSLTEVLTESGKKVGQLPAQDARLLNELGGDSQLYTPHLLEIRTTAKGKLDYVAVELVRPELRYCSSCGQKHEGLYVNCANCRKQRKKKREEMIESSPLSFHEAIDAIASDQPDRED